MPPLRSPYLEVALGDIIMDKISKRLGVVKKKGIHGSPKGFYVTWLDNGELGIFWTRKQQSTVQHTGNNINNPDSDSD